MAKDKNEEADLDKGMPIIGLEETFQSMLEFEDILSNAPGAKKEAITKTLSYLVQTNQDEQELLKILESRYPAGAMLVNTSGKVVAITQSLSELLHIEIGTDLFSLDLEREMKQLLRQSLQSLSSVLTKSSSIVQINADEKPRLAAIEPFTSENEILLLLRLVGQPWNDAIEDQLQQTFALTSTEIELTRRLYQGTKVRKIAELRNRSIDTVRTQVKQILRKTNSPSQSELVSKVAALIADYAPKSALKGFQKIDVKRGSSLFYHTYGAPDGDPVLMIHTSSDPHFDEARSSLFKDANLKVIAPLLFEGLAKERETKRIEVVIERCHDLLTNLNIKKCVILGHREGGIYASHIAANTLDLISGVLAIDTSIPTKTFPKELFNSKLNRFIRIIQSYPFASEMAYRLLLRIVNQGDHGMWYYFKTMYVDDKKLLSDLEDPELFEISSRNTHYIFENCAELVKLIGLYYSDWENSAQKVVSKMPLQFLQGDLYSVLPPELVEGYCAQHKNLSCRILKGEGQCLLYTQTSLVVEEILKLTSNS